MTALSLYALHTFAAEDDVPDALGCVIDDITGNYRCDTGPLAGREFVGPEEAQAALKAEEEKKAKDREDEALNASYSVPLRLMSWNFSSIGTARFEYDRIAAVLADSDFAVLQEVEFNPSGETSLTVIADILAKKTGERICKGWFKTNYGTRGRHAFVWKDKVISYVEKNGAVEDRCPDAPVVIRVVGKKIDPSEPLMATFFLKTRRQMFNAVSVQLAKKPKKKEITAIFGKLSKLPWPAVVAGNFKTPVTDKSFKAVMARSGGATSNVWTKNLSVVHAEAVDLHDRFPDLKPKEVDAMISDYPPVLAEISFSPEEADVLRTQLIKKNARASAKAARERKFKPSVKPAPKPLPVHDDLEEEAGD
jgi:hypothetical protein